MTRFASHSLALVAAVLITLVSLQQVFAVPAKAQAPASAVLLA